MDGMSLATLARAIGQDPNAIRKIKERHVKFVDDPPKIGRELRLKIEHCLVVASIVAMSRKNRTIEEAANDLPALWPQITEAIKNKTYNELYFVTGRHWSGSQKYTVVGSKKLHELIGEMIDNHALAIEFVAFGEIVATIEDAWEAERLLSEHGLTEADLDAAMASRPAA